MATNKALIQEVLGELTFVIWRQVAWNVGWAEDRRLCHEAQRLEVSPRCGDGLAVEVQKGTITARVDPPDDLCGDSKTSIERHRLAVSQCAELSGGVGEARGHKVLAERVERVLDIGSLFKGIHECREGVVVCF